MPGIEGQGYIPPAQHQQPPELSKADKLKNVGLALKYGSIKMVKAALAGDFQFPKASKGFLLSILKAVRPEGKGAAKVKEPNTEANKATLERGLNSRQTGLSGAASRGQESALSARLGETISAATTTASPVLKECMKERLSDSQIALVDKIRDGQLDASAVGRMTPKEQKAILKEAVAIHQVLSDMYLQKDADWVQVVDLFAAHHAAALQSVITDAGEATNLDQQTTGDLEYASTMLSMHNDHYSRDGGMSETRGLEQIVPPHGLIGGKLATMGVDIEMFLESCGQSDYLADRGVFRAKGSGK